MGIQTLCICVFFDSCTDDEVIEAEVWEDGVLLPLVAGFAYAYNILACFSLEY
jgi:hypothetical protein